MLEVANQNEKMNNALALTGNYAGVTSDQLRNMAQEATAGGASFNTAVGAVTALASTGRLTGDEIARLGQTIADTATYTSTSAKEMVDDFTKLADDPVTASVKLNDQYHYLTESVYDQITALKQQGDATGAAQLAVEAFSQAMTQRTTDIASNEGIILSGWRNIKSAINDAIEAVGSFGAKATTGQVVDRLQANKAARLPIGQWSSGDEAELQQAIAANNAAIKAAQDKASNDRQQQALIDAKHSYDVWNSQFATPAEKRAKEIQSYIDKIATPLGLSPEQQIADETKIDSKYKDPKTAKPKQHHDDAATTMLQQLRDQDAAVQSQLSSTDKLTDAQQDLVKFNQQISDWQGKQLTSQQQSLVDHQDEIRAALQLLDIDQKQLQANKAKQDLQNAAGRAAQSAVNYQSNQQQRYGQQLDAVGMGTDAQKQASAVSSIYAEYNRLADSITKVASKGGMLGSDQYKQDIADNQTALQQSLQLYTDYYNELKAKQADWKNGVATAMQDYIDESANTAAESQKLFTDSMKGMEDAITTFATTGKLSFTNLANSIISDLVRMQLRAAESGIFSNLASIGGSLLGSFFSSNTSTAASVASALPGNSLDNLMSLTNGFGTVGARAGGGNVSGGQAYYVGEQGPELFVPGTNGKIVPNHASAIGGAGGGDVQVQVVNNSSAQVGQPKVSSDQSGKKFIRMIIDQAKSEIAGDMASGQGDASKALTQRYGLTPRFR